MSLCPPPRCVFIYPSDRFPMRNEFGGPGQLAWEYALVFRLPSRAAVGAGGACAAIRLEFFSFSRTSFRDG